MIWLLSFITSGLAPERQEAADKVEATRKAFDAAFGHFDAEIEAERRRHGHPGKPLEAKQLAVHAALGKAA